MKAFDLLFYLNYKRESDRFRGYLPVFLASMMLALGVISLVRSFGLDLVAYLNGIYPFDYNDSVRSLFNKKSGAAVLFGLPFSFIFCWIFYSRARVERIIASYDSLNLDVSTPLIAAYSIVLIVGLFASAAMLRNVAPEFSLATQLLVLGVFNFVVADRLIDYSKADSEH